MEGLSCVLIPQLENIATNGSNRRRITSRLFSNSSGHSRPTTTLKRRARSLFCWSNRCRLLRVARNGNDRPILRKVMHVMSDGPRRIFSANELRGRGEEKVLERLKPARLHIGEIRKAGLCFRIASSIATDSTIASLPVILADRKAYRIETAIRNHLSNARTILLPHNTGYNR